jgi:hypothetical protein
MRLNRLNAFALLMVLVTFALCSFVAFAQADVNNPTGVEFAASVDHAVIDSYELDILRPDNSVLQTLNLGKPAPGVNNLIHANINVQPVSFGVGYSVRVRAKAGTAASDYVVSSNKFNRVPGGPGAPVLK